ncbi:MAG: glycosyltransferase family 2 protein [Rhodospirillales bacterium]|nr:glycosyltransferase family 2 protein [Alphaproteobacteria bacterium]MCB9986301.1 glycosyltransferase family 2 protein [Rhodospirillales bacterium]USO07146.1 MAG: glycosyltransferase family 2 protein [Rhodospirillales bacterium]
MIPASVIVVTKNEGENLAHCLLPLVGTFRQVVVVDSNSTDDTMATAKNMGAEFLPFSWNGKYPKKRQWCLDAMPGLQPWVFFVDADEVATPELIRELRLLFARGNMADGYFVRGRYVWLGRRLRFGMANNKLCLFRRDRFRFPVVGDLDIPGMGEIEGHYQPLPLGPDVTIGQVSAALVHYNRKGRGEWNRRHERYATWEAAMIARDAFPPDPVPWRQELKTLTRASWARPYLVFLYAYVLRAGFLDGAAGLDFALARAGYARDVQRRLRSLQ